MTPMTSSVPEPEATEPAPQGAPTDQSQPEQAGGDGQVVIVGPDGVGLVREDEKSPLSQVEQPAKVMRIGNMIKQLLEEVRNAPLDEAGRARLAEVHERSLAELEDGLSEDLVEELRRISLPFDDEATPSDAELRIAQAQLVGWLEGLFHGIQTALVAQQMAAQQQISQMRRALPGGPGAMAPTGRAPASTCEPPPPVTARPATDTPAGRPGTGSGNSTHFSASSCR